MPAPLLTFMWLSCTVLSFQVNLGTLLTGLGSGALLDPDKSVLGQTVGLWHEHYAL
jgi:hypothetical protein